MCANLMLYRKGQLDVDALAFTYTFAAVKLSSTSSSGEKIECKTMFFLSMTPSMIAEQLTYKDAVSKKQLYINNINLLNNIY